MISEDIVVPIGDLRKDVMMFNEAYLLDHSDTVLRGIQYYLERDKVADQNKSIDDLSNLEESELKSIKTEILINATTKGNRRLLTFDDVHTFAKGLSCCYFKITKMRFTQCGLSAVSIEHLSKALKFCYPHLQYIAIERNPLSSKTGERDRELRDAIEQVNPKFLNLYRNNIQKELGEKGSKGSSKSKVEPIPEYPLTPTIPEHVLKASAFCFTLQRRIKHLSLRDCGIGDAQVSALAEALSNHTTLLTLNLWGNDIGRKGLAKLGEGLRTNRVLLAIDLSLNSRISDRAINEFAKNTFGWKEITGLETFQNYRLRMYQSQYGVRPKTQQVTTLPVPEWVKQLVEEGHPIESLFTITARKRGGKSGRSVKQQPIQVLDFDILECDLLTENDDALGEDGGVILIQKPIPPVVEEATKSSRGKKKNVPKKMSARKKKLMEEELRKKEEEEKEKKRLIDLPWKFLVMGNRTLRSVSFSCNRLVTDRGVTELLGRVGASGLKRVSFTNTNVGLEMLEKLGELME